MMIKAVLDVGSGSTKLLVCRVVASTSAGGHGVVPGKEFEVLFGEEREVLLAHDLEAGRGSVLSDDIMGKCKQALRDFQNVAKSLGAEGRMFGVGTQVFRTAKNGAAFLEDLAVNHGVDIKLVTQQEEGQLGFLTAAALCGEKDIVCWDSGGASFQLSRNNGADVLKGPLGSSLVTAAMVRLQGKTFTSDSTCNPVSENDVESLTKHIESVLADIDRSGIDFSKSKIVAIGGATSVFNIARVAVGHLNESADELPMAGATVTVPLLERAIQFHLHKTDETIGFPPNLQPAMVIPKLVLLHCVMKTFQLQQFTYYHSTGSCLGVLAQSLQAEQPQQQLQ